MLFQVLADKNHISICIPGACEIDKENFNLKIKKMMKDVAIEAGEVSKFAAPRRGMERGLSIVDFILRILAAAATLGAAVAMGQNEQTLSFSTQFVVFRAEFDDLPTFMFFLLTNSIVCGYLVLSLMLSAFHIVRSNAVKSRILLIFLDTVMLALLTAAASAAAAIVYIAHYGNPQANWFAVCLQFPDYCQQASGTLIGAFGAAVLLIILILMSAVAISRH